MSYTVKVNIRIVVLQFTKILSVHIWCYLVLRSHSIRERVEQRDDLPETAIDDQAVDQDSSWPSDVLTGQICSNEQTSHFQKEAFQPRKKGPFIYVHFFTYTETASVLESNWILFDTEYNMAAGIANWKDKAEKT